MDIQPILFGLFVLGAAVYAIYREREKTKDPRDALIGAAQESGWSNVRSSTVWAAIRGEYGGMAAAFDFQRPKRKQYGSLSTSLAFQCGAEFEIRRRPYLDDSDWLHKLMAESPSAKEVSIPDALAREFIVECQPGARIFVLRILEDPQIVALLRRNLADELDSASVARDGACVWRKLRDSVLIYGDMNRLAEMGRLSFELLTRIHDALSPAR